jgi:hypothetical protein
MINFSYPLSRQDYWKLARTNVVPFKAKNELDDWAIAASIVKVGRIRQARDRMSDEELAWWSAIDQGIWLVRLIRASDEEIRGDRIESLHEWCRDVTADVATAMIHKPSETVRELTAIALEAVELTEELYPFTLDWVAELEAAEFGKEGN